MQLWVTTLCENTSSGMGFAGEWGLSVLVEFGGEKVLVDTGFGDSIINNAAACGINLQDIEQVVISHGHVDHTGGLRPLLQKTRKKVYIYAHHRVWDNKVSVRSAGKGSACRYIGIPYRLEELKGLGALFSYSVEPVWLNKYMVTTGEIPQVTSFESMDKDLFLNTEEGLVPDSLCDDQALIIKTGKGLVLILGCAHRGTVNTMLRAREVTGVEKIYALIGGTHLYPAGREQLQKTMESIKNFGVEKIGVSHCTGLPAAAALLNEFPDKFFFNNAGTRVKL